MRGAEVDQRKRLIGVDLARSAALAAMVAYHFTYDLDLFGFIPPGTSTTGWFWWHARLTAGSFIFLAGLSLWLAHGQGIRWVAFRRRFLVILAAALAVTAATHFALPGLTVFYGILHSIAVSSLLALMALRLPALVTMGLAALVFWLPGAWSDPAFNGHLIWTGLGTVQPATADFLPLFPWLAPMLAGVATGRILQRFALWRWLDWPETPFLRRMAWPGQHSLAIYLIHQPVLIGLVLGAGWLASHLR